MVVLDCGNKAHLTEFERIATDAPSNFVTKLRKHLKTRRLSGIKQLHGDRVLVLQFSDGLFYLVLEFFSAGNILLLDGEQKILSLQRMVNDKGDNDRYAVNETYKLFDNTLFTEKVDEYTLRTYTVSEIKEWIAVHKQKLEVQQATSKKAKVFSIHKLLFVNASHLSSDLIQKTLMENGVEAASSCLVFGENSLEGVVNALHETEREYSILLSQKDNITGYIVSKKNPNWNEDEENTEDLSYIYDEFHPFKPYKKNIEDYKFIEVAGYNATLDKFFSTLESSKFALKIEQKKQQAKNRLDHARSERDKQISSLVEQQEINAKKGDAIILYADLVSQCQELVQGLLDQQMDWTNIESYIQLEQSRRNPTASVIKLPLNLSQNKIHVMLPFETEIGSESDSSSDSDEDTSSSSESDSDSDSDSDSESFKPLKKVQQKPAQKKLSCWVDLSLSPYANAALYFDTKKSAGSKQVKVEKSTVMALKSAEKKINQDLAKSLKEENDTLKQIRPKFWFEKFLWFVSSEGYLCLAGRDNSQVDMLYYRHFNDNDFFVSADVEGSLKVFIKNPYKDGTPPLYSLWQAGVFALSASSSWNSKTITSSWFVPGPGVSKKDFDGTLMAAGDFNVKGKKEYLAAAPLVMGFGFYALADEETTQKYEKVRLTKEEDHGLKIVMDNKKKDLEGEISRGQVLEEVVPEKVVKTTIEKTIEPTKTKEDEGRVEDDISKTGNAVEESKPEIIEQADSSDFIDPIEAQMKKLKLEEQAVNAKEKSSQKGPKVRGKKAKLKKIATKYADQDDEERLMRMDVLGTLKQVNELKLQKEKDAEAEAEAEASKYKDSAVTLRRKKEDEREYQKYLANDEESESSVINYLEILDSFLEKPQPTDVITNLIPVFAPWASLNKFKYKVKVQPGDGKKGKAVKDIVAHFTSRKPDSMAAEVDLDTAEEREYIKDAKPADLVGVFTVARVKAIFPGTTLTRAGKGSKNPNGKRR